MTDFIQHVFDQFGSGTTLIGVLISLVVGYVLKRWPTFNNKFIPIASAVIAFLTQILNYASDAAGGGGGGGVDSTATHAMIAMPIMTAGLFSSGFFKILINALVQAWLATGIHSSSKNIIEAAKSETVDPVSARKIARKR